PWVILLAARLSTRTLYSDWPSMSMKPGATTRREASIRRAVEEDDRSPTAAIRLPTIPTSARNQGAPVPSTTRPPAKIRSNARVVGIGRVSNARIARREEIIERPASLYRAAGRLQPALSVTRIRSEVAAGFLLVQAALWTEGPA